MKLWTLALLGAAGYFLIKTVSGSTTKTDTPQTTPQGQDKNATDTLKKVNVDNTKLINSRPQTYTQKWSTNTSEGIVNKTVSIPIVSYTSAGNPVYVIAQGGTTTNQASAVNNALRAAKGLPAV